MRKPSTVMVDKPNDPDDEPGLLNIEWVYDDKDPRVLTLSIFTGEVENPRNEWSIGRELLTTAYANPRKIVGYSDVKVTVIDSRVWIILCADSDESNAYRLIGDAWLLRRFLTKTYQIVPINKEKEIIDNALKAFLTKVSTK